MKTMEHTRPHSKHIITGLSISQFPLYPFQTSDGWLPILSPGQILVNVHGILIHTVYETVFIIVQKIREELFKIIIIRILSTAHCY